MDKIKERLDTDNRRSIRSSRGDWNLLADITEHLEGAGNMLVFLAKLPNNLASCQ